MGGEQIIEIIQKEDLIRFFFELDKEYLLPDWDFETSEGKYLETDEEANDYLTDLGLNNYEDKGGRYDTSEFWNVVYFPDHDVYLKISGKYDSYGQYEHSYDTIKEVKPKEVTTTVYN